MVKKDKNTSLTHAKDDSNKNMDHWSFGAKLDSKNHLDTEHKVVMKIKNKIREEPNESNVPLKKFKQKRSVHQSMSIGEEFDTNIQSELSEKSNLEQLNAKMQKYANSLGLSTAILELA